MYIYFQLDVGFDVAEAGELVEMPSEGVPGVVEGLVACTDEAAAFDDIMPLVESRGGEVFVDRMDFELLEGVDGGDGVLPDISYHVVEVASLEHVDWVGRHPELHVDVPDGLVRPAGLVLLQHISDRVVFVFGWQASVLAGLLGPPLAESSCLQIIHLGGPVPRHIYFSVKRSELVLISVFPPEEGEGGADRGEPPSAFFSPQFRTSVASLDDEL